MDKGVKVMVRFMTDSIKVGKGPSFSDIIAKMKKASSSEQPVVKTAAAKEDKEADSSGQPEAEAKLTNKPEVEKEETPKKGTKKAKDGDEAPTSGQTDVEPLHQKGESVKPSAVTTENKKTEASNTAKFVKVAKLNTKTKTWLKAYWSNLYGSDYAEAMVAD